jgi:peptidoglycan/xylan/chitin deacetylase (PgdA/CDA1 family)
MALLKEAGYQAVGLEKAVEKFRKPGLDSRNMAVITFDDGFRDFHSSAVPLLVKHNFSATMFLPTAFISRESRRFKDRDCLTWEEVRECRRAGMEFGSHTVNHPWLYEMSVAAIRTELEVSKAQIESQLGERVSTFAYPYAFPSADRGFVEAFVAALRDAGYESSVTTRIGRVAPQDDPFTLRRLPANTEDDKAFFLAKLRGDYDWMSWPQEAFKRFKRAAAGGRSPKSRLQAEQSSVAGK